MPARRPREWWAITKAGAIVAAIGLLALAAAATLLAASGPLVVAGVDLAEFGAAALFPAIVAFAVWRIALWQDAVDRRHSMSGDQ